jgi:heme-degrading monooxygenase HmoA
MYTIIFEFFVLKGNAKAFEELYGPGGDWIELFRKSEGFIGTELMINPEDPHHYVTVDKWNSEDIYYNFLHEYQKEYQKIDARGDSFTFDQRRVGSFFTVV